MSNFLSIIIAFLIYYIICVPVLQCLALASLVIRFSAYSAGKRYTGHAVCCAIPLGVLQANQHKLFSPALPAAKVAAILKCGIGYENKVALKFERVFWPDVDFFGTVGVRYAIHNDR